MSCREGSAGPKGWLWYQPTNDSPRRNRLWQICRVRITSDPPHNTRGQGGTWGAVGRCFTSSSTAPAASASPRRLRHGKACSTVSTAGTGGGWPCRGLLPPPPIAYAACWCPSGPPGSRPLHCASDGCGNPTGKGNAPMEPPKGSYSPPQGGGRTSSRRTLLEMATLKGWNLLMAAKDVTSTRVCGLLQHTQPRSPPPSHPRAERRRCASPPGCVARAQRAVADGCPGSALRPLPRGGLCTAALSTATLSTPLPSP